MPGIGHFNGSLDKAKSVHPVRGSGIGAGRDHSAQLGNQQPVECVSYYQYWTGRLQVIPPLLCNLTLLAHVPLPSFQDILSSHSTSCEAVL